MRRKGQRSRPYVPKTAEEVAWRARADRYRRDGHNLCELCEWRSAKIITGWWTHARLQVHHGYGRRYISEVGQESDFELHTLCLRCHAKITRRQGRYLRQADACDEHGKITNLAVYSQCVQRATAKARPRYLARAWHRVLLGAVPSVGRPSRPALSVVDVAGGGQVDLRVQQF